MYKSVAQCVTREQFDEKYAKVYAENETWNNVPVSKSELFPWQDSSTYIQNPPFFEGMTDEAPGAAPITSARCLCLLGDLSLIHISEPTSPY